MVYYNIFGVVGVVPMGKYYSKCTVMLYQLIPLVITGMEEAGMKTDTDVKIFIQVCHVSFE
jgi:hypothetical protein